MSHLLRQHLRGLAPVPHGGAAQLAATGLDPATVLDFSATVLPGGPPDGVHRALRAVALAPYPDPHCHALRAALAARHDLAPDHVLPANGSVALIRAIAAASLDAGHRALVVGPSFGEYAQAIRIAGAEPVEVRTEDPDAVLAVIARVRPRLVFCCSPNNPTGHRWAERALAAFEAESFLVLDEAYAGFLRPPSRPVLTDRRLVLRSLTKDHGLAGVRLGYGLAPPRLLDPLREVLTPWGVNAVAQAVGIAALAAREEIERRIDRLWADRDALVESLRAEGWNVDAREAPFFLVRVGDGTATTAALLGQGIAVRDATSFGMPDTVRISPRTDGDNAQLVEAFARLRLRGRP